MTAGDEVEKLAGEHTRIGYRPDIDGLRAIAVLAVIGFHASPRFVPGGFVGVDIFFVISGFLISSILFTDFARGRFSFAAFYLRRIRRILPALIVVLAASWLIGWLVLVQSEYLQLEKHLAGGSAFVSNVLLWGEAGYFDVPSESKPLLHLWSLGIEEQFYLFWPPLLYLCWTRGLNVVTVTLVIVTGSFALNVALIGGSAVAAFYLPHTRMWELLLGALLAYDECFSKERTTSVLHRLVFASPDRSDAQFVADAKAWLGLALILLPIVALGTTVFPGWWFGAPILDDAARAVGLDKGLSYPGWWAALPTLGTAFLIWAGPGAWVNRAILARRGLVYLGLMSYPLYLWHWPLLSFIRITESGVPSKTLKLAAVAVSFLLAWITYVTIERPIRRTMSPKTPGRLAAVAATLAIVGAVSFLSFRTEAFTSRTPSFATAFDAPRRFPEREAHCREKFRTAGEYCQPYAEEGLVTTALIGDSHAEHLLSGVGANLGRRGENVVLLGHSGCPPLLDVERFLVGTTDRCHDISNAIAREVGDNDRLTRVILSFRGALDVTGTGFGVHENGPLVVFRTAGTNQSPAESMRTALLRTVEYFVRQHKQVSLILQVPELDFQLGECVGRPFSFLTKLRTPCAVNKGDVEARQALYRQIVRDVSAAAPVLAVLDPLPALCDERHCFAIVDGTLMYQDANHLNRAGSLFVGQRLVFQ